MNRDQLIKSALEEDLGRGDITTDLLFSSDIKGRGKIAAKQDLVLAGSQAAQKVFEEIDKQVEWKGFKKEGDFLKKGETAAELKGRVVSLLKGERTALNFLQHLSGIATLTRKYVEAVKGTKAKITDTRKTTPGWRQLEKAAVKAGGGENHRFGLFDRYLIKNNHIDGVGGIEKTLLKVRDRKKEDVLVEVEVRNLKELKIALQFPIDICLLDNFSPEQVREAVKVTEGKVKLEASGGITLENVREYAEAGVDFISCGALTHSAPAADLHFQLSVF